MQELHKRQSLKQTFSFLYPDNWLPARSDSAESNKNIEFHAQNRKTPEFRFGSYIDLAWIKKRKNPTRY